MKHKTLMLSGVAFGTFLTLSTFAVAAGIGAVGGVTGSVGGAAGGMTTGLSGSVSPATGTIGAMGNAGTQTDIGAPPLTPPSATGSIKTPTPSASVGAETGGKVDAPAIGVTGSTGIGVPVANLSDPLTTLQHAAVKSRDGASIGTIQSVKTGTNGKASTVKVSLANAVGETKEISLKPSQLSFDQKNKIVVSSLSQAEIDSLAAAQK